MEGIGDSYFHWESSSPPVRTEVIMLLTGRSGQKLLIKTRSLKPKAFKGLDNYRLYSDGWITCASVYATIGSNPSILYHSQSTPLRPWVGIKKDRCIIVAHCTCHFSSLFRFDGVHFSLPGNLAISVEQLVHAIDCVCSRSEMPCTVSHPNHVKQDHLLECIMIVISQ